MMSNAPHPTDLTHAMPSSAASPVGAAPAKSPRGVQPSDVWAAADALLAQGLRPTIERVRLHLGRGSPNTVSPMLEGWFAALGERLRLAQSSADAHAAAGGSAHVSQGLHAQWVDANALADIPAAVAEPALQSLRQLWAVATHEAHSAAQSAVAEQQKTLDEREAALQSALADLAHREAVLREQKRAMDEALALAQQQSQQLAAQLQDMQLIAHERQAQITQLGAHLERERNTHVLALAHEREQHAQALAAAHAERDRVLEQAQGNERRLLLEIDRTRQDAQRKLHQQQNQFDALQAAAQQTQSQLQATTAAWQNAQAEVATLSQSLEHERERAAQLKALWEQHLAVQSLSQASSLSASASQAQAASSAQNVQRLAGQGRTRSRLSAARALRTPQALAPRPLTRRALRKGRG